MNKVLVIDDEPDIRELLKMTLQRMQIDCDVAENFHTGIELINKHNYFLVLTDMHLPDGDGYNIVSYIQKHKPSIPVAVITAYGNVEGAVNTLKAGAFDYVSKPIDMAILRSLIQTAQSMQQITPKASFDRFIGNSNIILEVKEKIIKLARSQAPVFIHGESGSGKELVAKLIHLNSPRSKKPFIPVNCAAITSELMESEFFGHVKGSFTGAHADKEGLFQAAKGGTLFLDEIAELPLAMQVKLFRAIQERAVKPVGAAHEEAIDVRILSASNKKLEQEVQAGRFRQELYYRINVIELTVPSLREHIEDIPILTEAILQKLSQAEGLKGITITPAAINKLKKYDFPGNIRELENILERALIMSNRKTIDESDLQIAKKEHPVANPVPTNTISLELTLEEHEKSLIIDALEKTKWNRTAAAELLGISFRILRYRMKKLGIE